MIDAASGRGAILDLLRARGVNPEDVLKQLNEELARQSLVEYGKVIAPWFQAPPHIIYLAGFLERAERGEISKLAISAPPGHGKSTLLQLFVSWFIGRDPYRRALALSASESLARRNSRGIRGMLQAEEWPWPNVKLIGESLEEWQTAQGGGTRSIGESGTVTGFRAELLLLDDIQADAGSDASRPALEERYRQVFSTRLEPGGITVLINTRWGDDDIIGRLQEGEDAHEWVFINIPAIAISNNDVLGRAEGEALWPERWPLEKLESQRRSLKEGFDAQYQGDPIPAGGGLFKPDWLEHTYEALPTACFAPAVVDSRDTILRAIDPLQAARALPAIVIQAVDSAWKTGAHNDRSVIATLTSDLVNIYIANIWADRVHYTELKRILEEQYDLFAPRTIYVEEAASGYALVDELKRAPGKIIPIIPIKPGRDDKVARAEAVTGWFESARVKLPRHAPWLADFKHEFLRFPYGAHDDIVDAVVLGVAQMQQVIGRITLRKRRIERGEDDLGNWMAR